MAQIHLIGGEKGGVGKSLVARLLAQYMIDREIPFLGFDTDRSHGALLRFYAGYAAPVQIDRYEMLDHIIEAAVEQPERRMLVDLAAQTHEPLQRWIDESGRARARRRDRHRPDLLACDGQRPRQRRPARRGCSSFGDKVRHVLVRNQLRGDDFRLLDGSAALAQALSLGRRAITIRHLNDAVMQKIDASSSSFWAASQAADKETTGLGMMDRQRVKVWLRDTYAGFDSVGV